MSQRIETLILTLSKENCLETFSYHAFKKTGIQVKTVLCTCKENPVWKKKHSELMRRESPHEKGKYVEMITLNLLK